METFNKVLGKITNNSIIGPVVSNPLFATLLVTATVAVVLIAVLRGEIWQSKKKLARILAYVGLCTTVILALHYYGLRSRIETSEKIGAGRRLATQLTAFTPQYKPPTLGGFNSNDEVGGTPQTATPPPLQTGSFPRPDAGRKDNVGDSDLLFDDIDLDNI
jgi:hypothetical protein